MAAAVFEQGAFHQIVGSGVQRHRSASLLGARGQQGHVSATAFVDPVAGRRALLGAWEIVAVG